MGLYKYTLKQEDLDFPPNVVASLNLLRRSVVLGLRHDGALPTCVMCHKPHIPLRMNTDGRCDACAYTLCPCDCK